MATSKFKLESPYNNCNDRVHHPSDKTYQSFVNEHQIQTSNGDKVSSRPIGMVLFGLGRIGTLHLKNILALRDIKLLYIVEMDKARRDIVQHKYHLDDITFLGVEDYEAVFKDPRVTAALVASPTSTHEVLICQCLRAGLNVFGEKPISPTLDGIQRCYKVAKETGKLLFCAFNKRFDPSLADIKERVHQGEVGHIQVIKQTSRDSPIPPISYLKTSGGIFHDCAVHDIDLLTWICGEFPNEVYIAGSALIPEIKEIGDLDTVVITLRFPSGTIGIIDLSRYSCYGYDQRLEVFGRKSMIRVDDSYPNATISSNPDGVNKVPIHYSFPSRYAMSYANELDYFVKMAQGGQLPNIDSLVPMACSKIGSACDESARTGKPVQIDWTEEEIPSNYL